MHENSKLAVFKCVNSSIISLEINNRLLHKLPLLELSSKPVRDRLINWIKNRGIPATRQGIKSELRSIGQEDEFRYMLNNLGLSLTDHYWIKPVNSDYRWETVNLYTNDFTSRYSLDLDTDKSIACKTNFIPSASLKGDLKKKWIIDSNGVRRLVKGNASKSCRQSICEVIATEIHKRQGRFEYTPYSLIKISSDNRIITGCECPNFTSIYTEFIPAISIIESIKKESSSNYYNAYIKYCGYHGIDDDYMRQFMEYQILTDFIITNTDRHLNNFGVIRDSNTFKLMKPAPIFDSGNSMFYNTNFIKTGHKLLNIEVTSFRKYEVKLLEYVSNPMIVDLNKLPSENEIYELLMIDRYNSCEDIVMKLIEAYRTKIELLNELQCGIPIYSYKYLSKYGIRLRE